MFNFNSDSEGQIATQLNFQKFLENMCLDESIGIDFLRSVSLENKLVYIQFGFFEMEEEQNYVKFIVE